MATNTEPARRRLLWFVALWAASAGAALLAVYVLRNVFALLTGS
ncbi:MAG: hypothetical protein NVS9B10_23690 [Nevskia sp.]